MIEILTPSLTVDTAIYASGDALGSKITLTGAMGVRGTKLLSIVLCDKANQKAALDVLIFNQDFTAQTDNAAVNISTTDAANLVGHVSIAATDYITVGTGTAVATKQIEIPVIPGSDANLYAQLVSRGTPTYGAAGALVAKFGLEKPGI